MSRELFKPTVCDIRDKTIQMKYSEIIRSTPRRHYDPIQIDPFQIDPIQIISTNHI